MSELYKAERQNLMSSTKKLFGSKTVLNCQINPFCLWIKRPVTLHHKSHLLTQKQNSEHRAEQEPVAADTTLSRESGEELWWRWVPKWLADT